MPARIPRARFVHPIEALEDTRTIFLGNSWALVEHVDRDAIVGPCSHYADRREFRPIGARIRDKISQHIVQLGGIRLCDSGAVADRDQHLLPPRLECRCKIGHHRVREPAQVARRNIERLLAGVEPREAQQVLDEALHPFGVARDDRQETLRFLRGRVSFGERFDVPANGRQRRAQLEIGRASCRERV